MATSITRDFIRRVPKTDLHVHLDGSLRVPTLIELARDAKVELPSYEEAGLRETVFTPHYEDLAGYLHGFAYTTAVLSTAEALERAAYELVQDALEEGVRYMEVRFAPQLHVREGLTALSIVRAVAAGLDRAATTHNASHAVTQGQDLPFHSGIVVCAMRSFHENMSPYFSKLLSVQGHAPRKEVFCVASLEMARSAVRMRDEHGLPIVGFDLAGEEAGYPAYYHRTAYQYAHTHFLKKTVHAGEAYGPESIFQAITDCHANRIGHGTFLFAASQVRDPMIDDPARYVEQLVEYVASQRITLEVCLTSNLQTTPSIRRIQDHPLKSMMDHNLSVSLCTDNRLVSHTSVTNELELAVRELDITRHEFRNLVVAGFKGSFFPGSYNEKRAYVRRMLDRYEALEEELLR